MKYAQGAFILFAVLSLLGSCKKAEIDTDALNTNPFDRDYTGEAIFSFVAERTLPYPLDTTFLNFGTKLEVDARVNTALFPKPTSYVVRYALPSGDEVIVPLADLDDDVITMTVLDVEPGTTYCFFPRLGNNGSYGPGNTVCGTAE